MPVLNLNEDEKTILLTALIHERVRLMKEWTRSAEDYDSSPFSREADCAEIDAHADEVTDLRRKIEVAVDISKAAWHNAFGWLHPKKAIEVAAASIEAGDLTREEVADVLGVDLDEVDAENARDRVRMEQMSPGTWTTLPEGFDVDDWMFDITDPDDRIVIASADTQTDGTKVAFYSYDLTPAEKHKIKRELQGYDLITWNETLNGDYHGMDSSEHEASVIFIMKTKADRYEIHPGSDISPMFRKHMKSFFSSRSAYNSFEEVRNLVHERAVAFFKLGGKSMSKRHLDIEISINGQTKTLRGTAGEAERLLKELTAAQRRF